MSLFILLQTYTGQFLAFALPSVEVAAIIGVLVNSIFFLFMGFNPPASAIPGGYQWLYTITPPRYGLAIMGALVFGQCDELPTWDETTQQYLNVGSQLGCQPLINTPVSIEHITVKEYAQEVFGFNHDNITRDFGVTILCIVFFRVLALLSLRFINHQKR